MVLLINVRLLIPVLMMLLVIKYPCIIWDVPRGSSPSISLVAIIRPLHGSSSRTASRYPLIKASLAHVGFLTSLAKVPRAFFPEFARDVIYEALLALDCATFRVGPGVVLEVLLFPLAVLRPLGGSLSICLKIFVTSRLC
jgi:hypothetical protein